MENESTPETPSEEKDWTIMIYMAGDNNLSQDMITGLSGIKEHLGHMPEKVAILAYYDSDVMDFPTVTIDFTGSLHIEPVRFGDIVQQEGSVSKESLENFIRWCVNRQPAANYALILSGHGDGLQPENFLRDETSKSYISLRKLGDALRVLVTGEEWCRPDREGTGSLEKKHVPLFNNKKIAILGFDSCVMSSTEVAVQVAHATQTIVASQGFVPNAGWNYGRVIQQLKAHYDSIGTPPDRLQMAEIFGQAFWDGYKDYALFGGVSVDVNILDLELRPPEEPENEVPPTHFEMVTQSINSLATDLTEALDRPKFGAKIAQLILTSHWRCQTYLWEQYIDIGDFCGILAVECEAEVAEIEALQKVILENLTIGLKEDASVEIRENIASIMSTEHDFFRKVAATCRRVVEEIALCSKSRSLGAELQYSTGLSMYFPWSLISYYLTYPNYTRLRFVSRNDPWVRFLDKYLLQTFRLPKLYCRNIGFSFDADGAAFNESDRESFRLNALKNIYLPYEIGSEDSSDGIEDNKVGLPQVRVGLPETRVGLPETRVGLPETRVGWPQNRVGMPQTRVGLPETRLGPPYTKLHQSISNSENFSKTKNFPWAPRLWDIFRKDKYEGES